MSFERQWLQGSSEWARRMGKQTWKMPLKRCFHEIEGFTCLVELHTHQCSWGMCQGNARQKMEEMEESGQPEAKKPRLIAKTDMRHAMPHGDCLKPCDGNEKREKRNRAGQLPGPRKRKQAPGKWEGVQG